VALGDAEAAQRVGQAADAGVQLAVAHALRLVARAVGLENQRGLVAAGGEVAVQAVHAEIELAVGEPADPEVLAVEADVADAGRRRHPLQSLGDAAPERVGIADGLGVVARVVGPGNVGLRGEVLWDGVDIFGHGGSPSGTCTGQCAALPWDRVFRPWSIHGPARATHNAAMDPVPGLDLSLPPFDLLDDAGRRRLHAGVDIGFHPGGTTLIEAGSDSPHVFVLLKGLVHAFQVDDRGREERFADYGPGDVIGAWAVMAGRARISYRSDGDCLSHLIPAATFRQLLADNPRVAAYFNEGLATKGRLSSGSERGEAAELMVIRVGEADLAPPERVDATTSIADASTRLRERRVDCLLVYDRAHDAPGIVTRTDLLDALTRLRLPLDAPIGPLASRPLATIGTGEVLFQALIDMTERQIERVVVTEGSKVAGTLGMAEVLAHFASHSHLISLRLARARDIDAIAEAASGMPRLVRSLNVNGTRIPYMMELVSALNTRIMGRIFELVV